MLIDFRATAYNKDGLTFQFNFKAYNWNGVELYAEDKLSQLVESDDLHKKNAPWFVRNIDIGF